MPAQRIIPGIGLAILLAISASSIGLDVKSRNDAAWVDHTLGVLKKISDMRLLLRRAESAARGFLLTDDPNFVKEYQDARDRIGPALAELRQATADNPAQTRALDGIEPLVTRRLAVSSEGVRLRAAGDTAGLAAMTSRAEGRAAMETVTTGFDGLTAEEERLLTMRSAGSQRTGIILLTIDLAGAALILLLAAMLIRESRRSSQKLETSLRDTRAENQTLEAAVAERTEHLVAAHEELRHSAAVLRSTFHSMAEAVIVMDASGAVMLSNPAAERMLQFQSGMHVDELKKRNIAYLSDGETPMPAAETPVARLLRGEPFDGLEVALRQPNRENLIQVVASGRPMRDSTGAISGAALVCHDITSSRETERKLQQAQKLDAIGKLTGGVAHDFNNMLTVITGTTEALVAELAGRPELQQTAHLIDQAAERCAELIKHLLAFARRQPLQPRNVDINGTVARYRQAAAAHPRRADRDRNHPGARGRHRPYRPVAACQFRAQHGDQRPRCDAEWRQIVAGDPQCRAR